MKIEGRSLLNILKVCTILLVVIFIVMSMVLNFLYDMTGFDSPFPIAQAASKFAPVTGYIKQQYMGNSYIDDITTYRKSNRTLVYSDDAYIDVGLGTTKRQKSNGYRSRNNHTIVWYNKPDWFDIKGANDNFKKCFYINCLMTQDHQRIQNASAVMFSPHESMPDHLPVEKSERNPDQAWVLFGNESPANFASVGFGYRNISWRNTMNWTMSYKMDADIFYPYGMLKHKSSIQNRDYRGIFHKKSKHAAWIVSHCGARSRRDEYVKEMKDAGLQVDIYGKCSDKGITEARSLKAIVEKDYKFYLSFENTFCEDYITEKFFGYYGLDVVLVARGGANYSRLLPLKDTFIDASSFPSAKELVDYLIRVANSEELYTRYLTNKNHYEYVSGAKDAFCILCDRLNNIDDYRSSIGNHVNLLHRDMCWEPTDITGYHLFHVTQYIVPICLCVILILGVFLCYKTRNKSQTVQNSEC